MYGAGAGVPAGEQGLDATDGSGLFRASSAGDGGASTSDADRAEERTWTSQ
jgi:hypothetical protein